MSFLDDFTAYQYVTRYDSTYPRPVVILGGLNEPICDKLVMEFPNQFSRCLPGLCLVCKVPSFLYILFYYLYYGHNDDFFFFIQYPLILTLSWWWSLSYRNQSIDLLCKSLDWFLYDRDLRHESVNESKYCWFSCGVKFCFNCQFYSLCYLNFWKYISNWK